MITGYKLDQLIKLDLEGKQYDDKGYLVICITSDPLGILTDVICNGGRHLPDLELTTTLTVQVVKEIDAIAEDEVIMTWPTWPPAFNTYRMWRKAMYTAPSGYFDIMEWNVDAGINLPGTPGESERVTVSPTRTPTRPEGTMAPTPYGKGKGKGKISKSQRVR